ETTFMYMAILNAVRMLSISMVMMPVTTSGLNQLPDDLIPHGSAMNNTFRQMAGAIGTAMLVTIMSTAANPSEGTQGLIDGVNMSFYVATVLAALGFILSFYVKHPERRKQYKNPLSKNERGFCFI